MSTSSTHVPVYIGPPERPVFGQLHLPLGDVRGATLLVPAWGRDGIQSHRSLQMLARRLCADGQAVLRIDLDGTGHGPGDDFQPDRVQAWQDSIHHGLNWLRAETGAATVNVIGFRLGATLAWMCAAQRDDIGTLGAMAPVARGQAFVRELRMLQSTTAPALRIHATDVLEATGFLMTAQTQADLSAINLSQLTSPVARQTLVQHRDDMPSEPKWVAHLGALGSTVAQSTLKSFFDLTNDGHKVQPSDFDALAQAILALDGHTGGLQHPQVPSTARCQFSTPQGMLQEEALFFGAKAPIFGILTQPANGQVLQDKAILFVNEGAHHGVGPQRLWVQLARRWASQGHMVLRFDITGIGDSPVRQGQPDLTTYGPMAVDDVRVAVDFLRLKSGARTLTALGLCSGSYHIYMAAVLGVRIDQLIPINQPVFQWEEGMSPDESDLHAAVVAHTERQAQATKDPRKWLGILTGEIPLQRVWDFGKRRLMLAAERKWQALETRTGLKLPSQLTLRLRKLARRGVKVHLIYGPGEMGYDTLMAEAAKEVDRLQAKGQLSLVLLPEGNHVFSDSGPMQQLIRHLDSIVEVPATRPVQTTSHHALQ